MLIIDKLLVSGLRFVLDRVTDAALRELDDTELLREELLAAQMELELGEISEEEFAEIEAAVLARMREKQGGGGALSFGQEDGGVAVSVDAETGRER